MGTPAFFPKWIPSIAPVKTITVAAILAIILAVSSAMLAMHQPWLGINLDISYNGHGVKIDSVTPGSPADGCLRPGEVIVALSSEKSGQIEVPPEAALEEPDQLGSYAEYNAFFASQQAIWEVLSSEQFVAILDDGRKVQIRAAADYPGVGAMPFEFWLMLLFGGASFLMGISVWSLRQREPVTCVLAVSGLGYMVGAYCAAIYMTRELALPAQIFHALSVGNHLGIMVFAFSAILFFWYYPRRLGQGPAALLITLGVAALWLNETLQWWSWPAHVFYAYFVVAYCVLVLFTLLQWRKSRDNPLERALLKWLLATMLLSLGFTIALFYIPVIVMGKSIASMAMTFSSVFVLYISLIFGTIRYHQFDMHYWWKSAWQWLIFILIVLICDVVFGYFLQLGEVTSSGLSVGLAVIYLLLRQWFWTHFSGDGRRDLDHALPHVLDALFMQSQHSPSLEPQWRKIIERVFNPLSIKVVPHALNAVLIEQDGLMLLVPSLAGTEHLQVFCRDRGKRLFVSTDLRVAGRLIELLRHTRDLMLAREQGVQEERQRIQRDLHDDVAARLLSLLHQTREEPALNRVARNAFRGLREVIHLLDAGNETLENVLIDIEADVREQLTGLGVELIWQAPEKLPEVMMSPQQHINVRRIVRETIANALKHAAPETVLVEMDALPATLCLCVGTDSIISNPADWKPGRGLNNIKTRAAEMNASHEWGIEQRGERQYCCLTMYIPLGAK